MKLQKGQTIYIKNQKYIVSNMIEFKEDTWVWQEYEIVSDTYLSKWLIVEENENKQLEYSLYETYKGEVDTNEIEFVVGDKSYELYEKGRATVKNYFGNADVDKYETCEYYDYISKNKIDIISVEKWKDETEKSIGYYIKNEEIQIIEEIEKNKEPIYTPKNKNGSMISIIILLLFFLPTIFLAFSGLFVNKSIQKYLEKATDSYTYVTSVTSNTNNQKAKVYEASFSSIDLTVKDIIDGVPEGITQTIDTDPNTDEDGIGLQTNNEYAYIYQENGKVFVQVSSKEYVKSSGSTYHSRHYYHYYNSYNSTQKSTIYSNYASSARQKSINSRTLTGGGTSSGK